MFLHVVSQIENQAELDFGLKLDSTSVILDLFHLTALPLII